MAKKMIVINLKDCVSCGICVQDCPVSALALTRPAEGGKYPDICPEVSPNKCIGCGVCANNCPMDCISLTEV